MSEEEEELVSTNDTTPTTVIRRQNDVIKEKDFEGNPLARLAKKSVVQSGRISTKSNPADTPEVVEPTKLNLENLSDCRLIRPHELQPITAKMCTFE